MVLGAVATGNINPKEDAKVAGTKMSNGCMFIACTIAIKIGSIN